MQQQPTVSIHGVPLEELVSIVLAGTRAPAAMAEPLGAIGLTRLDVWHRLAGGWSALAEPATVTEEWLPAALVGAATAPDPDAAVLNLSRLQAEMAGPTLIRQIAADPRFAHDLLFLLGAGSLPGDSLVRDPGLVDLLLDSDALASARSVEALTAEALRVVCRLRSRDARRQALRRWKREQFLRIIIRDLLLHEPQQVITREISAVADACVEAALSIALAESGLGECGGEVPGLCVVAMGKWGSRELNYNSDIDLLCVFLPTPGGPSPEEWEGVVRDLARHLDETTAEGRVFQVDFRLRPEGGTGSLVRSLESCAAYYQSHGEAWEAQALTRARCAAGDRALGGRFEALAEQVAYGTRVTRAGIANIRRNRQRIDARADAERNVKEGHGGIRDIEFTVQLMQLARGVTDPRVRGRNTWHALEELTVAGAVTEAERRLLHEAYDFLRRVEHLLQIQPVAPTKLLPTATDALRRLARGLGYRDGGQRTAAERFMQDYRSHTAATRELCQRLFFNPIPLTSPDADLAMQELLDPLEDDAEAARHLADIPFEDPLEARRRLLFLAHGEPPMRLPPEIQALFVELLPALLACIQRMPAPDAALRWFERFIARAGGRAPFYRLLLDHPPVIELLCRLGGFSDWLSQTIVDRPELLDRVIDPRFTGTHPDKAELAALLAERLRPLRQSEARLDDIRRFRRREQFRIGVQDLLGAAEVEEVTAQLTELAEVCLDALLTEARGMVAGAAELPFAIVGCGKLAGRELHYRSDLDVLFAYQSDDPAALQVAELLAQTVAREAERRTAAGMLYELDARLRPFGANASLARSIGGYRAYFERHAASWERLAMSRARQVAGDPAVGEALVAEAHRFALRATPSADELAELRHVKQRIENERQDLADPQHLDLKVHPGGIMEIEFLTQLLQIVEGRSCTPNTLEALAELGDRGVLPTAEAELLRRNYRAFRRLETRLQIVLEWSNGLLPLDPDGLAAAAKRLGWSLSEAERRPDQLLADLRARLQAVRDIYERRVGLDETGSADASPAS